MTTPEASPMEGEGTEFRVYGPPGCGKTTWLGAQAQRAVEQGKRPLISSLTRTAAAEVAGRDLPIPPEHVGTLHAHCYRMLGQPEIAEDKAQLADWNERHPSYEMGTKDRKRSIDEDNLEPNAGSPGDRMMGRYQVLRARMETELPPDVAAFAAAWTGWKQERGLMDFTDLIETCLREVETAPGDPDVLFVDEAQDLDFLEMRLVRKWGERAGYLVMVGDPDQCQPAGTMVETAGGPVPIEKLDPGQHRILTWDRHEQKIAGYRKTRPFETGRRHYRGPLLTVHAGGKRSRSTPEHRWVVRWVDRRSGHCAVCLMRRGSEWRVGWSRLFDDRGAFRLEQYLRQEGAGSAWVLAAAPDRREAAAMAAAIAARHGLAEGPFPEDRPPAAEAAGNGGEERARRCLTGHGRDPEFPLWERGRTGRRRTVRVEEVRACNLVPGIMAVPEYRGAEQTSWTAVEAISQAAFDGPVYSLRVTPHETYVADGLVTHNCLYRWRGSDPQAFTNPPVPEAQRRVLAQSYRVPRQVHDTAVAWINQVKDRRPVEYRPRDAEGEVRQLQASCQEPEPALEDAEKYLAQGKSVMFLTTCAYMLQPLLGALRRQGIPFHNPHRRSNGAWNPLPKRRNAAGAAERLLAYLALSESGQWTAGDLRKWTNTLRAEGVLPRKGRELVRDLEDDEEEGLSWNLLEGVLTPEAIEAGLSGDLNWYQRHLTAAKRPGAEFPLSVVRRRGAEKLRETPLVVPGTVHSVKGSECDVVYLFPDLSRPGMDEWTGSPEQRAAVQRLFYVGMTRARESLITCAPATPMAVNC